MSCPEHAEKGSQCKLSLVQRGDDDIEAESLAALDWPAICAQVCSGCSPIRLDCSHPGHRHFRSATMHVCRHCQIVPVADST